jgi:ABC-type multidrug transport system fused ATPase/permease subunit
MKVFKELLFLLTPKEYKHLVLLIFMILISALLDVVGVASIVPLITVLTSPNLVETSSILSFMFQVSTIFGVENKQQFLFALGTFTFLLILFSLSFKAITTYVQVHFVQTLEFILSKRLATGYLYQPYSWFLGKNSADLGKTILSEVGTIVMNGIGPLMELIAKSALVIALIILLILFDPKIALIVGFVIGGAYLIAFYYLRKYLDQLGKKRFENNKLRYLALSEAFGAAKEVKAGGLEKIYVKKFSTPAKIFAQTRAASSVIAQLPRFILEIASFGGILLILLFMMLKTGNFNSSLPVISLYVFAGYRLMPAMHAIYAAVTQLTFVAPALDKLIYDFKNFQSSNESISLDVLSLKNTITLKNVHYKYPNSSKVVLRDLSINIPFKKTVGLMGSTGSGKTTMVDILLGLIEPLKGTLQVDGKVITKRNVRSWQRSIAYVPQNIYLADDTVEKNIAFGIDVQNINHQFIENASKIAKLHNFVISELPNKYQTIIGERGVRLSGGQRQRIGIARALYQNPKILILDEATSALDSRTEKEIMDDVYKIGKDMTIIIIAHRLNTLNSCDTIIELEKGQIKNQFSYDELINQHNKIVSKSKNKTI